jgi:hypothetical protein
MTKIDDTYTDAMNVMKQSLALPCVIFCIVWGATSALADTAASPVHTNLGNTDDIKDELPSLEMGLIGGLGASMNISESGAMILEARHTMGLRSLYAHQDEDIKNRVWTFSLGYQHRFGR